MMHGTMSLKKKISFAFHKVKGKFWKPYLFMLYDIKIKGIGILLLSNSEKHIQDKRIFCAAVFIVIKFNFIAWLLSSFGIEFHA